MFFARVPSGDNKITSSPYTYGVLGLPTGGLLLGPTVYSTSSRAITLPSGMTGASITGVYTYQDLLTNPDNSTFFTVGGLNGSSHYQTALFTYIGTAAPTKLTDSTSAGAATPTIAQFPFTTVLSDGSNWNEFLIFSTPPGSNDLGVITWNGANGQSLLTSSTSRRGFALSANGRVWYVEGSVIVGLEASGSGTDLYNSVSYTNPTTLSNTANITVNTAHTIVNYDDISSFGAWGTVTSGETLVVNSNTGGLIISGDIFQPNVTKAPAVVGCNGLQCQAALTPFGLVYRSQHNGVWAWSGGAAATKISTQISDASFNDDASNNSDLFAAPTSYTGPNFANVQYFQNHIWFDQGYFYSLDTQSWWALPPYLSSTQAAGKMYANPFFAPRNDTALPDFDTFYINQTSGNKLNVTSYSFDVAGALSGNSYTFTPPAGYFGSFWESNPITLAADEVCEVQEVSIIMQGSGVLTVSCLGIGGNVLSNPQAINVNERTGFARIRVNTKFITDVLILQLGWTNSHTSTTPFLMTPIIDSIEVKYAARYPVPVAN